MNGNHHIGFGMLSPLFLLGIACDNPTQSLTPHSGSARYASVATGVEFIPLHAFDGTDGFGPISGLVQGGDGYFYGTTHAGGSNDHGTVFRIDAGGNLTTLHHFSGPNDGQYPYASLVKAADGKFYGTTSGGGTGSGGTVFRITPSGSLTTLHSFSGSDGEIPLGALIEAGDGNLYGTTASGGTGYGTVFRMTRSGSLTTLHRFSGGDGRMPFAALVEGRDGDFYGTGVAGGLHQLSGVVFKLSPGGQFTLLHSFDPSVDGQNPTGALVQGNDGDFYGTTSNNDGVGPTNGTVFRITPSGNLTTLSTFTGVGDGNNPQAELMLGIDGNFYGTTIGGGSSFGGTIFRISPAGNLTTLYNLGGTPGFGAFPAAGLVQGADGLLYGTGAGGPGNMGSVFKIAVPMTPANGDRCKDGAWARFTNPRSFVNQGDCMQFVNTGK